MSELTPEDIEKILQAMSEELPEEEQLVPSQNGYGPISKVEFSPLIKEELPPQAKESARFDNLFVTLEVAFGKKKITLKELCQLQSGSLVQLEQLSLEPADILVNGKRVGRGEIVTVDGYFGVRVIDFENKSEIVYNK